MKKFIAILALFGMQAAFATLQPTTYLQSIVDADLGTSIAMVTDGNKKLSSSVTTVAELAFLHGVTSNVQTQLNAKQTGGSYLNGLSGDVTTSVGSSVTTVAQVGGTSASSVATAAGVVNGSQSGSKFLASPSGGGTGTPAFRVVAGSDLPNPSASTLGGIQSLLSAAHKWINQISTSGVPSATQPAAADLSDGTTGSGGSVVLATGPTITGVTINSTLSLTGQLNGSSTTDSASSTTGAIITAGGIGVAKSARIGGVIVGSSALSIAGLITGSASIAIASTGNPPTPIKMTGSPTSIKQLQLGDSSVYSIIGTRQSGGDLVLAYNASQPTGATDSWSQSAADDSNLLRMGENSGFNFYHAASGTANASLATFWGSSLFSIANSGVVTIPGELDGTKLVAGNSLGLAFGASFAASSVAVVGDSSANTMNLQTNNVNRITISSTGAVGMPSLASSSAATTGSVCWTTITGNLTVDTTLACLASTMKVKEYVESLADKEGLTEVMAMRPIAYNLKPEFNPEHLGRMVGFIAEEAQKVDPRLVALDDHGEAKGFRYMQYTAILTKAIQEQQAEIELLQREVHALKRRR